MRIPHFSSSSSSSTFSLFFSLRSTRNKRYTIRIYTHEIRIRAESLLRKNAEDSNGGRGLERIGLHWIPSQFRLGLSIRSPSTSRFRFRFVSHSFLRLIFFFGIFSVCVDLEFRICELRSGSTAFLIFFFLF